MRTITVEEIDIIVQASVEQALTEFKKLVPQMKKTFEKLFKEEPKIKFQPLDEQIRRLRAMKK